MFRRIRHRLIEELGLDPSVNLQRMHQAVLADDPVLHARESSYSVSAYRRLG